MTNQTGQGSAAWNDTTRDTRHASEAAGDTVGAFAQAAADRLGTTASSVRRDAQRMMSTVQDLVTRNPGPALAVAAACGVLLGRALSRD